MTPMHGLQSNKYYNPTLGTNLNIWLLVAGTAVLFI